MPLKFGDEVSTLYVKFNAKENRWSINSPDGEIHEIDLPTMAIDLENIELGWFRFREGQAPDILLDKGGVMAPEPDGENHKRGFRVQTYSRAHGLREFSSNSLMLKKAMTTLFDTWEKEKAQHPGKVPAVQVVDHLAIQGRYGLNYQPVFKIASYHERPEEFPARKQASAATTTAPPPRPTRADVGAEASSAAPVPAKSPVDEFNDSIPY